MKFKVSDLFEALPGQNMKLSLGDTMMSSKEDLLRQSEGSRLGWQRVISNSKLIREGDLFWCLRGENFDGFQFAESALAAGAMGIVTERKGSLAELCQKFPKAVVVQVDDQLAALQQFANWFRVHRLKNTVVIGITGSNGKTTTKKFLQTLLGGPRVCAASPGSYNNHWGVPLSVLACDTDKDYLVLEMGMSGLGEIDKLVDIGQPSHVAVTMVGTAHIEKLGSREAIAKAKSEIYKVHSLSDSACFSLDQPETLSMQNEHASHFRDSKTFSSRGLECADVSLLADPAASPFLYLKGTLFGQKGEAKTRILGLHHAHNAAAALVLAVSAMESKQGHQPLDPEPLQTLWGLLNNLEPEWGRCQWIKIPNSEDSILFDAYNANPESMAEALDLGAELAKHLGAELHFVLGEMKELGDRADVEHKRVAEKLKGMACKDWIFVGPSYRAFHYVFGDRGVEQARASFAFEEFESWRRGLEHSPKLFVLKGSRGMQLESFFPGLLAKPGQEI